jgi:acetyl esterase/lipase
LVVHGTHDSLVPPAEAQMFVDALRSVSRAPTAHLETVGAQHAFDAISSARTRAVGGHIAEFLERVISEREEADR